MKRIRTIRSGRYATCLQLLWCLSQHSASPCNISITHFNTSSLHHLCSINSSNSCARISGNKAV